MIVINEFERKKLLDAEELFKRYSGAFYYMDHSGNYNKYKSYDIPKEQEEKWRYELCNNYLENKEDKDSFEYLKICECAKNIKDVAIIKRIIKCPFERTLKNNYVETLFMLKNAFELLSKKKQYFSLNEIQNFKDFYNNYWMKKFQLDILKSIKNNQFEFDKKNFTNLKMIEDYLKEQQEKLAEINI